MTTVINRSMLFYCFFHVSASDCFEDRSSVWYIWMWILILIRFAEGKRGLPGYVSLPWWRLVGYGLPDIYSALLNLVTRQYGVCYITSHVVLKKHFFEISGNSEASWGHGSSLRTFNPLQTIFVLWDHEPFSSELLKNAEDRFPVYWSWKVDEYCHNNQPSSRFVMVILWSRYTDQYQGNTYSRFSSNSEAFD